MDNQSTLFCGWTRLKARIADIARNRRGVAAVEFAFIAPVLLGLYFVTMEVAQAIETNKKVGRVASMVADLVTQQRSTTATTVDAIMRIGEATLQPYNRTVPKIIVTGIQITDEESPKAIVVWSRKMEDQVSSNAGGKNSPTTVPEKLKIRNTFLVRVEAHLDYRPVITWTASQKQGTGLAAAFDNINMQETYFLRPRMSPTVPCDEGC